ncbi:MAG: ABC transporter substrate-binding protein, partial [Propionibacteriaceae bacterium]|nr:ABC transporter substrate-binding protein [Propionibacteriaceae bacterium]
MKKPFLAALGLALIIPLVACGTDDPAGQSTQSIMPQDAQESVDANRKTTDSGERFAKVTIAVDSDPQDMLPYDVNAASKPYIFHNFYEALFDLDNSGYVPRLAKSWEMTDETHYRVTLYDYIKDSAGNPITADDVVFSTKIKIDSGYAFRYEILDKVSKVDDYTVEYTWKYPVTQVGELEFPWCRTYIVSQKAWES